MDKQTLDVDRLLQEVETCLEYISRDEVLYGLYFDGQHDEDLKAFIRSIYSLWKDRKHEAKRLWRIAFSLHPISKGTKNVLAREQCLRNINWFASNTLLRPNQSVSAINILFSALTFTRCHVTRQFASFQQEWFSVVGTLIPLWKDSIKKESGLTSSSSSNLHYDASDVSRYEKKIGWENRKSDALGHAAAKDQTFSLTNLNSNPERQNNPSSPRISREHVQSLEFQLVQAQTRMEKEIKALKTKNDSLNMQIRDVTDSKQNQDTLAKKLQSDLRFIENTNSHLEAKLKVLSDELVTKKREIENITKDKDGLSNELISLKSELSKCSEENKELKQTLNKSTHELTNLQVEAQRITSQRDEYKLQRDQFKQQLDDEKECNLEILQKMESDKTREIEKLQLHLGKKDGHLQDLHDSNHVLEQKVKEIQDEIKTLKEENASLVQRLSEAESLHFEATGAVNLPIRDKPVTVVQEFDQLMDKIWLAAKGILSEDAKEPLDDRSQCDVLNNILSIAYDWAEDMNDKIRRTIQGSTTLFSTEPFYIHSSPMRAAYKVETSQNAEILESLRLALQKKSSTVDFTTVSQQLLETALKPFISCSKLHNHLSRSPELNEYGKLALRLCWRMILQKPVMTFDSSLLLGKRFSAESATAHYGSEHLEFPNAVVQYYVHPALYHGENLMKKALVFVARYRIIESGGEMVNLASEDGATSA